MEVGSSLSDIIEPQLMPPVPPPADPPLPHDSASHHAEEPSASSSSRTPAATRTLAVPAAPRVNRSPDDILRLCCPNRDWSIVLKNCDWRFESQCRLHLTSKDSAKLYAPYSQKTFSRAFISIPWQDALMDVHDFTWRKWRLLKHLSPLPEGVEEQVPGRIPQKCLELLGPRLDPHVLAPPRYGGKPKSKAE